MAISGDTIIVGAYTEDSSATGVNGNQGDDSATDSGAVYVFVRSGTNWSQPAYLKASNSDGATDASNIGDLFGSVTVSGDTVVVGAFFERSSATGVNGNQTDNSAVASGAAYVFIGAGIGPQLALLPYADGGYFIRFTGSPDVSYQLRATVCQRPLRPLKALP